MKKVLAIAAMAVIPAFSQVFPGAIAGDGDLLVAYDNAQTQLSSSVNSTTTTIPLVSSSNFGNSALLTVESEKIFCPIISSNVGSSCIRNWPTGGTGSAHAAGTTVSVRITKDYHNLLVSEIKAIEAFLGINGIGIPRISYAGAFSGRPAASSVNAGLAFITDCNSDACGAGGGHVSRWQVDTGSSWVTISDNTSQNLGVIDSSSGNTKMNCNGEDSNSYCGFTRATQFCWASGVNFLVDGSGELSMHDEGGKLSIRDGCSLASALAPIEIGTCVGGCHALKGTSSIDFSSIPDGTCASNTFSLSGAATADYVNPLIPAGINDGVDVNIFVSATNTIKVKLCNLSGAAYDPGSLTFGAQIVR